MSGYSHFDESGRPVMVDVGGKIPSRRRAVAECLVDLPENVYEAIAAGENFKGDPIKAAELCGIMGAKKTPDLIPLCHRIKLDSVRVKCELMDTGRVLRIECEASANDVTGVEMEAMVGVTIAALVFYDMCKGIDKGIKIREARLLEKSGGKSGLWKTR
jgi:cyclic pyranopterin phosphate synthase